MPSLLLDADILLFVDLLAPQVVQEGEAFFPSVNVSQTVEATFLVYSASGSAISSVDFESFFEFVNFVPSNFTVNTSSPVITKKDNLVELDETLYIKIEFSQPREIKPHVNFTNNGTALVTITDSNSEFL